MTTLVRLLKDILSSAEAPSGQSVVGDREGKRIRELCLALLQVTLLCCFQMSNLCLNSVLTRRAL